MISGFYGSAMKFIKSKQLMWLDQMQMYKKFLDHHLLKDRIGSSVIQQDFRAIVGC